MTTLQQWFHIVIFFSELFEILTYNINLIWFDRNLIEIDTVKILISILDIFLNNEVSSIISIYIYIYNQRTRNVIKSFQTRNARFARPEVDERSFPNPSTGRVFGQNGFFHADFFFRPLSTCISRA